MSEYTNKYVSFNDCIRYSEYLSKYNLQPNPTTPPPPLPRTITIPTVPPPKPLPRSEPRLEQPPPPLPRSEPRLEQPPKPLPRSEPRLEQPPKPFLQLPIRNFKWRGHLCWMYAYLQYIYRIKCIHDLILSDDNIIFNGDEIKFNFKLKDFNKFKINISKINKTINITELFINIWSVIHDKKVFQIKEYLSFKLDIQNLFINPNINSYINANRNEIIIISLWFIFKYLEGNTKFLNEIYRIINNKKIFDSDTDLFSFINTIKSNTSISNDDTIQEFIHIFILILVSIINIDYIYEDHEFIDINNILQTIFTCLPNDIDVIDTNQTCFILFRQEGHHYVNIIKDEKDNYNLVDSLSEYHHILTPEEKTNLKIQLENSTTPILTLTNTHVIDGITLRDVYDFIIARGGNNNSIINSYNKFKLKYNLN